MPASNALFSIPFANSTLFSKMIFSGTPASARRLGSFAHPFGIYSARSMKAAPFSEA